MINFVRKEENEWILSTAAAEAEYKGEKSAAPWQGCTSVNTVFLRKQSELGFGYMSNIYLGISWGIFF